MATTIVLDGHELESKKAEAKSKVISALVGCQVSFDQLKELGYYIESDHA